MDFSRRGLLQMLAKAAPVVIASHFGVTQAMAADMKREALQTMGRTQVAMPGETMLDRQEIWFSVANVANVWAEELKRQNPWAPMLKLRRTCRTMAKAIDKDLISANVPASETKVLVEIPKLTARSPTPQDGGDFDIRAGVVQTATLWSKRTRIGYIGNEGIITGEEVDKARRGLFGLS